MLTANDAQAAIAALRRSRAVSKLLSLNEVRQNPALAGTTDFQRRFKGYYRIRKGPLFCKPYFRALRAAAEGSLQRDLTTVLELLSGSKWTKRHLSFASKLLATVDDDAVIYDKLVAGYFDVPTGPLPNNDRWIPVAASRYEAINSALQAFVEAPGWAAIRSAFDTAFPDAKHLHDRRVADLLIWAHCGLKKSKGYAAGWGINYRRDARL